MAIKAVLTDLGYTLIYNNKYEIYHDVLRGGGVDTAPAAVDRAFHLADKHIMREFPGLFMKPFPVFGPMYLGVVNYFLGVAPDLYHCALDYDERRRRGALEWRLFDGITGTIDALRAGGVQVILVSNWDGTCREVLRDLGLESRFDHIVISCEAGIEKPDPRIFEQAIALSGVGRESCIYVGDNYYDDGLGSSRVGLRYVILNRFGRLGTPELTCDMLESFNELPEWIGTNHS